MHEGTGPFGHGGTISANNRRDLGDDSPGAVFGVWLMCDEMADMSNHQST